VFWPTVCLYGEDLHVEKFELHVFHSQLWGAKLHSLVQHLFPLVHGTASEEQSNKNVFNMYVVDVYLLTCSFIAILHRSYV
jgi:hypothetical protein